MTLAELRSYIANMPFDNGNKIEVRVQVHREKDNEDVLDINAVECVDLVDILSIKYYPETSSVILEIETLSL